MGHCDEVQQSREDVSSWSSSLREMPAVKTF
jgi:hypothetical protein